MDEHLVLVAESATIGSYFYIRLIGRSHPFVKLIGAYNHHVATLGD